MSGVDPNEFAALKAELDGLRSQVADVNAKLESVVVADPGGGDFLEDTPAFDDGVDGQPRLYPLPRGGLKVLFKKSWLVTPATALEIGGTEVTLPDDDTSYYYLRVVQNRGAIQGLLRWEPASVTLVVNQDAGYKGTEESGDLPEDAQRIDVLYCGSVTTASGRVTVIDPKVTGTVFWNSMDRSLPDADQGAILYKETDTGDWIKLDKGASGSILVMSGNVPAWLAPGSDDDILEIAGGVPAWAATEDCP